MAESHQPPYSLQPPQQSQSMPPWYGMPPHFYQAQQGPAPPPQHHSLPWTATAMPPRHPPGDQGYGYVPQHYHPPPQGDVYPRPQQVHHHYTPPPQPTQTQFTYMYGQQDQVWHQANNSWGYQQWSHTAQTASLSQEELWAAKARAWAASKAIQDESGANPSVSQPIHQDFMFQHQEQNIPGGLQPSLRPPGQEVASIHYYQDDAINQGQSTQLRGQSEHAHQILAHGQTSKDMNPLITTEPAVERFNEKAFQAGQSFAGDGQSMFDSSQAPGAAASYGPEASFSGPQGNEPQLPSEKTYTGSAYSHQATHMLPQSQASPLMSQPHLPYTNKASNIGYDQQQQQMPSSYRQPPPPPNPQQPPTQVLHQPQKPPLQNHYPASNALEGVEGEFGRSPGSLQNWAPVGGPGMPFPPAMGAGTSQFDPVHGPHQLPLPWRPDGAGLQGLGFPNGASFAVGTSLGLGPGPQVRPPFAPDSFIERPKKAAVPSWLREELLKKKAARLAGNASGMLSSDESSRIIGAEAAIALGQRVGISDKVRSSSPGLSEDEEEDQEEEIEAARLAAINQEIKSLLTEVLLKVTGDLFKEIAQEVLDEDCDDILQGMSSPDEETIVEKSGFPLSPTTGPITPSGRVFLSSGRNPGADDNARDNEMSDSGGTAGDVLGLGSYASDDELHDSKDNKAISPQVGIDTHNYAIANTNPVEHSSHDGNSTVYGADEPSQSSGLLHLLKGNSEGYAAGQMSAKQETSAYLGHVQNCKSPLRGDPGLSSIQVRKTTEKERASQLQGMPEWSCLKEMSNSMVKEEEKIEDTSIRSFRDKNSISHSSVDASFKKTDNKETSLRRDTVTKNRKKEDRKADRARDCCSKERRKDDKTLIDSKTRGERDGRSKVKSATSSKEKRMDERTKDNKEVNQTRGTEYRIKDSGREKRKEMDKAKETLVRESDRDRKQEKKEKGRSRGGQAVQKKVRHLSTSSSSSASREGSSPSDSDRSRGRLRTRRSSRHHAFTSSPGRRKRQASRSRSRSPHVKHTHRRNVPSPSHEKSRRSGSKSPVSWKGRG